MPRTTTKSNLGVTVGDTETELIESTETDKSYNRTFGVGNGDNEIDVTVWGSDDNVNWTVWKREIIPPNSYRGISLGANHHIYVKLTGKTTSSGGTSMVDAYLTYVSP